MTAKNVVILGSTGTIGINALKVIENHPKHFNVVGLSCYNNFELFEKQVKQFSPRMVALTSKGIDRLKKVFARRIQIFDVETDLSQMVSAKGVDCVVIGMRGAGALIPFLAAVKAGKTVAPANKEALVMAGDLIMREAKKSGAQVIPIDSEQSAIFQALEGNKQNRLRKVYLTASGGALRNVPASEFNRLGVKDILRHPRWKMGPKITVDSATLMNKGFEVIEAMRLFNLRHDEIEVVVHPEAIIHSMVEFIDGSIIAQLGVTDMRLPIQYALSYPKRLEMDLPSLDFFKLKALTFEKPNLHKFPLLQLALNVAQKLGTLPTVLNAADEVAVEAYLEERISLRKLFQIVEKVVCKHRNQPTPDLNAILKTDQWAREETLKYIKG